MTKLLGEFREFIVKGNALDLAVGIIIGAAFGSVVASLVADIIMPPIGFVLGGVDFSSLGIKLADAHRKGDANVIPGLPAYTKDTPAVVVGYGKFINALISLLIQGVAVFLIVKLVNALRRKRDAFPDVPPAPPEDIKLLTEIRDALQRRP